MKVELVHERSSKRLKESINFWLENNKNIEIIDFKFQTDDYSLICMIIYEEVVTCG